MDKPPIIVNMVEWYLFRGPLTYESSALRRIELNDSPGPGDCAR